MSIRQYPYEGRLGEKVFYLLRADQHPEDPAHHFEEEPVKQRWRARWITSGGLEYEYCFLSLTSRVIARVDLGLQLFDLGYAVPDEVLLEEENFQPEGIRWGYPTIVGGEYGRR